MTGGRSDATCAALNLGGCAGPQPKDPPDLVTGQRFQTHVGHPAWATELDHIAAERLPSLSTLISAAPTVSGSSFCGRARRAVCVSVASASEAIYREPAQSCFRVTPHPCSGYGFGVMTRATLRQMAPLLAALAGALVLVDCSSDDDDCVSQTKLAQTAGAAGTAGRGGAAGQAGTGQAGTGQAARPVQAARTPAAAAARTRPAAAAARTRPAAAPVRASSAAAGAER